MTVNKELVEVWVDTLRSGNYIQGTTQLKSIDDKFCCLGVLCDIAKESVGLDWELEEPDDINYIIGGTRTVLPCIVSNYLGMGTLSFGDDRILISKTNTKLQEYLGDRVDAIIRHTTLVALNDYYQLSFDQIADILEEEFLLSGTINEDETTNLA